MSILKRIASKIDRELTTKKALNTPLENIIFFEGVPDFSDNSRFVFDEMIERGWNKKYKMLWAVNAPEDFESINIENVYFIKKESKEWENYTYKSRVLLSCNFPFFKAADRNDQLYIHLCHGAIFKSCGNFLKLSQNVSYVNTISDYNINVEAATYGVNKERIISLGYPRNDIFYSKSKIDLHDVFDTHSFSKCIVWLPTFRQNHLSTRIYSSISQPIIHNANDAEIINNYAKSKDILIVLKPHFNQNMDSIKKMELSNLLIIDDNYLVEKGVILYQVLSSSDAMITDYSSVFYDFLNADKPIGLCWEDFDEFNEKNSFDIDTKQISDASVIINNMNQFLDFVDDISNNVDKKREKRQKLNYLYNPYQDGKSSKRVVDFIEKNLR